MCGIVGVIPKNKLGFSGVQQKMFHQLLEADQFRGRDATGVVAVFKDESFTIQKEATTAMDFLFQKNGFIGGGVDKALWQDGVAAIGHNRAKTVGDNNDESAHPFVEGGTFAMVHNGTLRNHKKLSDTEVDSHALTITFKEAMEQEDWKTGMEDALAKVNGAFACVWYDQKKHQVCMIRNVERPLTVVETTTSVLFGSEVGLLYWIANRNGEKVIATTPLNTSTLYQFDLKKTGGEFSSTFLSTKSPPTGFQNGKTTTPPVTESKPQSGGTTTATAHSFDGDGREVLSKSAFKRLRSQVFRKTIRFEVEDVLQTGTLGKVMVFGECKSGAFDICDFRHSCQVVVDYTKLGMKYSYDLFNKEVELEGVISEATYDKEAGAIIFQMTDVKNVSETQHITH